MSDESNEVEPADLEPDEAQPETPDSPPEDDEPPATSQEAPSTQLPPGELARQIAEDEAREAARRDSESRSEDEAGAASG